MVELSGTEDHEALSHVVGFSEVDRDLFDAMFTRINRPAVHALHFWGPRPKKFLPDYQYRLLERCMLPLQKVLNMPSDDEIDKWHVFELDKSEIRYLHLNAIDISSLGAIPGPFERYLNISWLARIQLVDCEGVNDFLHILTQTRDLISLIIQFYVRGMDFDVAPALNAIAASSGLSDLAIMGHEEAFRAHDAFYDDGLMAQVLQSHGSTLKTLALARPWNRALSSTVERSCEVITHLSLKVQRIIPEVGSNAEMRWGVDQADIFDTTSRFKELTHVNLVMDVPQRSEFVPYDSKLADTIRLEEIVTEIALNLAHELKGTKLEEISFTFQDELGNIGRKDGPKTLAFDIENRELIEYGFHWTMFGGRMTVDECVEDVIKYSEEE